MTGDAPVAGFDLVRAELEARGRAARIAFAIYDHRAGTMTVSDGFRGIFGAAAPAMHAATPTPTPTLTPADLRRLVHPDDLDAAQAQFDGAIAQGRPFALEHRMIRGDGGVIWARREVMPKIGRDGRYLGYLAVIQDITDQRRAEAALQARERELRAILDNAPIAIFLKDPARRFRLVNRRYEEWFGKRSVDLIGRTDGEVYDADFARLVERSDAAVLEGARVREERPALTVDPASAHIRFIAVDKFPIRDDAAAGVLGICGFVSDITARKEAEDALRASEERFRTLIEHSSDLTAVLAPDGTLRYLSPSARDILGREPAERVGRSVFDFMVQPDRSAVRERLGRAAGTPGVRASGESRLRHADGRERRLAWTVHNAMDVPGIGGLIVHARDVTDERLLAEQLAQSQKMEAVGQLASGIAHEFNNILGAILGFAGFLAEDLEPGSEHHRYASRILQAGARAREVVMQILAFARRTEIERRQHDLRAIAREALDLLRASLPSSTQISAGIAGPPLVAQVNATQISQVLLNLCMNANDAAGEEPGTIAILLDRVEPGAADALGAAPRDGDDARARVVHGVVDPARAYARLAVADEGCGMPAAVLQRVFEPFFTTKPRGRGTGLGLPLVLGIVAAHGGVCVVDSAPGRGTTAAVLLPLSDDTVAAAADAARGERLEGRERILVVDDDADIVDMVTTGLDRLGYEAVGIADPVEALAAWRDDPAAWDVVVSDQVMPRLKGLAMHARMRAVDPRVRFILCTGFSDDASEEMARQAGVDGYFLKPVAVAQLAAAIRRLVDERPRPGSSA